MHCNTFSTLVCMFERERPTQYCREPRICPVSDWCMRMPTKLIKVYYFINYFRLCVQSIFHVVNLKCSLQQLSYSILLVFISMLLIRGIFRSSPFAAQNLYKYIFISWIYICYENGMLRVTYHFITLNSRTFIKLTNKIMLVSRALNPLKMRLPTCWKIFTQSPRPFACTRTYTRNTEGQSY